MREQLGGLRQFRLHEDRARLVRRRAGDDGHPDDASNHATDRDAASTASFRSPSGVVARVEGGGAQIHRRDARRDVLGGGDRLEPVGGRGRHDGGGARQPDDHALDRRGRRGGHVGRGGDWGKKDERGVHRTGWPDLDRKAAEVEDPAQREPVQQQGHDRVRDDRPVWRVGRRKPGKHMHLRRRARATSGATLAPPA